MAGDLLTHPPSSVPVCIFNALTYPTFQLDMRVVSINNRCRNPSDVPFPITLCKPPLTPRAWKKTPLSITSLPRLRVPLFPAITVTSFSEFEMSLNGLFFFFTYKNLIDDKHDTCSKTPFPPPPPNLSAPSLHAGKSHQIPRLTRIDVG